MALAAQRFASQATLEACVASGHRMLAGEPDTDAVGRVQDALVDLGYLQRTDVSGVFDERTGEAVSRFKTDEGLSPTDPVASIGTIGRLDALFAHEPPDPAAPDPGTDGLGGLALVDRDTAHGWAFAAETLLGQCRDAPPAGASPEALHVEDRGQEHFRLSEYDTEGRAALFDTFLLPVARAVQQVLMVLDITPVDDISTSRVRLAFSWEPGLRIHVAPGFRNALDDDARAFHLLRVAVMAVHLNSRALKWPGTARQDSVTTQDLTRNSVSYAALFHDVATGGALAFRAPPLWYVG